MKTLEQLHARLAEMGYKFEPDRLGNAKWLAYRRAQNARDCELNDRAPNTVVRGYDLSELSRDGHCWQSAEFSVTGKAVGRWFDFKAYGISIDEAIADHDKIAESLIGAWNGLVR